MHSSSVISSGCPTEKISNHTRASLLRGRFNCFSAVSALTIDTTLSVAPACGELDIQPLACVEAGQGHVGQRCDSST
jgi:hypothetical protein